MSRSLLELVVQLSSAGYRCVISSTCDDEGPLIWPGDLPENTVVLRRANAGYDFGSWAVALDRYPDLARLDHVVIANDSLVGPFDSMVPLLEAFDQVSTDVWSLTDSYEYAHHMQSFFIGFRGGILADRPLRDFFRKIRIERTPRDVVFRYEFGLTRTCARSGYRLSSHYRSSDLGVGEANPTLDRWERLLDAGFPFVKRKVITEGAAATGGVAKWTAKDVADRVRRQFGADLFEWL